MTNILPPLSYLIVVNVEPNSFKPPAIPQRHSPDLHGGWLLPNEGISRARPGRPRKIVQLDNDDDDDDDEDDDDDSDDEVEKAVIRVGANYQAVVPEKPIDKNGGEMRCYLFNLNQDPCAPP